MYEAATFEEKIGRIPLTQLHAPMLPSFEPTTLLHNHHHRQAKPSHRFLLYFVARKELNRSIVTST
jgi:hypothetical protein